ncbi:peptidoglycan/LPS O-acetylase OafA/YrhL [Rhodococcus sp. 27YEA15]
MVPDAEILRAINIPSWSLSVELFFYFMFPFLHRLIVRIPAHRLRLWFVGVAALIAAAPVVADTLLSGEPELPGMGMSIYQNWFVYAFPPVLLLDFILGILLARIVMDKRWIPISLPVATLVLVAGFGLQLSLMTTVYAMVMPTVVPIALVIGAAAVRDSRGPGTVFGSRTWVWLGEASFAFYMVHYLVLHYAQVAVGIEAWRSNVGAIVMSLLLLGASVAIGRALFVLVEDPLVKRWSRLAHGRRTPN